MRLLLTLAVASLAIATTACDNRVDDTAAANDDMAMTNDMMANDMNAMASGMAAMPAAEFVNMAAATDMYEIEAGKLASTMGSNAAVKSFGEMLVTDHGKSSADLKAAAAETGPAITPPAALPADKQAMIDQLKASSGAEFDRMFIDQQVQAHQMALDMLNSYAAGGDSEPLKAFAAKTAPVIQAHLTQAQGMKK